MATKLCPLCGATAVPMGMALQREYCACAQCDLRFISPKFHLDPAQEFDRYLLHQNSLSNAGYVSFLMGAVDYLKAYLSSNGEGSPSILDYGSGPVPVLVQLLNRDGLNAIGYDPFFGDRVAPGALVTSSLEGLGPFDAVVSTETVEHFRTPSTEWKKIASLIRPGGILVVMTSLVLPETNLSSWYYAKDPTHITFYTESTFRFIGEQFGFSLVETNGRNCLVMRKHLSR